MTKGENKQNNLANQFEAYVSEALTTDNTDVSGHVERKNFRSVKAKISRTPEYEGVFAKNAGFFKENPNANLVLPPAFNLSNNHLNSEPQQKQNSFSGHQNQTKPVSKTYLQGDYPSPISSPQNKLAPKIRRLATQFIPGKHDSVSTNNPKIETKNPITLTGFKEIEESNDPDKEIKRDYGHYLRINRPPGDYHAISPHSLQIENSPDDLFQKINRVASNLVPGKKAEYKIGKSHTKNQPLFQEKRVEFFSGRNSMPSRRI